jgi:hypothetical protein
VIDGPGLERIDVVGADAMEYHVKKFSALAGVAVAACSYYAAEKARAFAKHRGTPRGSLPLRSIISSTQFGFCSGRLPG